MRRSRHLIIGVAVALFGLWSSALMGADLSSTKSVRHSYESHHRYDNRHPERSEGPLTTDFLVTAGQRGYTLGFYSDEDTVYEFATPMGGLLTPPSPRIDLGIQQRKFHAKTFYTILGFSYEQDPYDPAGAPMKPEKSVVYAVLGIGSLWQWHFLNVGIDWLNASIPALERTGSIPDAEPAYMSPRTFEEDSKVQLRFLQIFVGVTF